MGNSQIGPTGVSRRLIVSYLAYLAASVIAAVLTESMDLLVFGHMFNFEKIVGIFVIFVIASIPVVAFLFVWFNDGRYAVTDGGTPIRRRDRVFDRLVSVNKWLIEIAKLEVLIVIVLTGVLIVSAILIGGIAGIIDGFLAGL